jgi:pyridoxine 4-dehydrogenase
MPASRDIMFGDITVRRLGFGAMRLSGPLNWGPPADWDAAVKVARRAVDLGVNFIDTADAYGPGLNEELLADALYPYPEGLLIATKAGQSRPSPDDWVPLGRPEYLRQQCELSLRRLHLDRIDLYQLHRVDPLVPVADQIGALRQLQDEGKIAHIGLSEVTVEQLTQIRGMVEVVSVQNLYNLTSREHQPVLEYCEREAIPFITWLPIGRGQLTRPDSPAAAVAKELDATPAQVALAWLLHVSPVIAPIPGTSSQAHLEENLGAADLTLSDEQFAALSRLA